MGAIINILVVLFVTAFRFREDIAAGMRTWGLQREYKSLEDRLKKYLDGPGKRKAAANAYQRGNWKIDTYGNKRLEVGSEDWFNQPQVQRQLRGIRRIYRMQVIDAIHNGITPPEQVGFGRYTRETLRRDWDDEWQDLSDSMGIKLFKKVSTLGTPGYRWVDADPEKELTLTTNFNAVKPPNGFKYDPQYDVFTKVRRDGTKVTISRAQVPPTSTQVIK